MSEETDSTEDNNYYRIKAEEAMYAKSIVTVRDGTDTRLEVDGYDGGQAIEDMPDIYTVMAGFTELGVTSDYNHATDLLRKLENEEITEEEASEQLQDDKNEVLR